MSAPCFNGEYQRYHESMAVSALEGVCIPGVRLLIKV